MRTSQQLSALSITRIKEPGYYSDGGNLFLQVTKTGAKSWIFRYGKNGKKHEIGLGPLRDIPLAKAREKALQCRLQILEGLDPLEQRKARMLALKADAAQQITFKQCAEKLIHSKRGGWKNAKHAQQWENTLAAYVYPHIGDLPTSSIDTAAVRKCIDPIWSTKTETANRVRQRIEAVMDWAKTHGHRTGDNPAAWHGHLEHVMAEPVKLKNRKNHAALAVNEISSFTASIRKHPGTSARALEFLILTAARTREVTEATWAEIDFEKATWTIHAGRMKAKTEHTVPLSPAAVELLKKIKPEDDVTEWVFPGGRKGKPLSNMAMLELLRGMGTKDTDGNPATVHGFRSTFRQWAAEHTDYPREVAEHALAHKLPDKVEAAYQRSTLFVKRRALMNDWAAFVNSTK